MKSIARSFCEPKARCRKWRECQYCGAVRQAQIANIAEIGAMGSRSITYAVVKPLSNDIAAQKTQVLKHLSSEINGAIWTIETGSQVLGLHANLIIGSDKPIHAAQVAAGLSGESEVYAQRIPHTDIRKVASYVAKPSNYPEKEQYSGRLYGSVGDWKKPLATMVEANAGNGVMAALALEEMLEQAGIVAPDIKADIRQRPLAKQETPAEVAARIRHNKKAIDDAAIAKQVAERKASHHKYMQRVLAAHVGEIELNGFVYVTGYGLAGVDDLHKFGLSSGSV